MRSRGEVLTAVPRLGTGFALVVLFCFSISAAEKYRDLIYWEELDEHDKELCSAQDRELYALKVSQTLDDFGNVSLAFQLTNKTDKILFLSEDTLFSPWTRVTLQRVQDDSKVVKSDMRTMIDFPTVYVTPVKPTEAVTVLYPLLDYDNLEKRIEDEKLYASWELVVTNRNNEFPSMCFYEGTLELM